MRFTLNLATKKSLNFRLINRVFTGFIVFFLLFLAWNGFRFSSSLDKTRKLDEEIKLLREKLKKLPPDTGKTDSKKLHTQISFYNGIIERKKFGWLNLLEKIEISTPKGIALSSLTPDRKGNLKINGLASDFKSLQSYLEALEESTDFTDIRLLSHENEVLWEQARGIRFKIQCRAKAI